MQMLVHEPKTAGLVTGQLKRLLLVLGTIYLDPGQLENHYSIFSTVEEQKACVQLVWYINFGVH